MIRAAMRQAQQGQRSAFFAVLRVHDFLMPADPDEAKASVDMLGRPSGRLLDVVERVKNECAAEADAISARHIDAMQDCGRAATHLQLAALALSAQRCLLREAASSSDYVHTGDDTLSARSVVANALGVIAPPDGSVPYSVPAMWLPNRTAVMLSWNRAATIRGMVANFETDLGKGFELSPLEPAPSCQLTRCLYTDFLRDEGEPLMMPIFHALHEATFKGVPGYEFEPPEAGVEGSGCTFWFRQA